jgi:hypothetical protein
MRQFLRKTDGTILEAGSPQALETPATQIAGATATFGIVRFVQAWTSPISGRSYEVGDFEKFDATIPADVQLLAALTLTGIVESAED